jgi:uncharacterized membrane protein YedE/YeeE
MNNIDQNTDFETRSLDTICINESHLEHKWYHNIKYLIVGLLFGIVFIKSRNYQLVPHSRNVPFSIFSHVWCYGSAVVVGMISVFLSKIQYQNHLWRKIEFHDKKFNKGQIIGGLIFGLGWAITERVLVQLK